MNTICTGKAVPVIINNWNRHVTLAKLLAWLSAVESDIKIVVIDNHSTYQPVLDYYQTLPKEIDVIMLGENLGPFAPWVSGIVDQYQNDEGFYVVTDSDVVPRAECPMNVIDVFKIVLGKNDNINKIGFSLDIFNIPETYSEKWEVINHELRWWQYSAGFSMYYAAIDTTFALYKKAVSIPYRYDKTHDEGDAFHRPEGFLDAVRTGHPFMAQHLPWHEDSGNLSDEDRYIQEHKVHWVGDDDACRAVPSENEKLLD